MSAVTRLKTAWKLASERNASLLAAGVAFYVFLALFPAMIAGLLTYGLVVSPETVARQSDSIADALPADAASVITGQLESLAQTSSSSLSIGFLIAVVLAVYSASGGMANLVTAINAMLGNLQTRNFLKQKLLALGLTVGAGVFLAVTVTLVAVAPPILDSLIDVPGTRVLLDVGRFLLLAVAIVLGFGLVIRSAPDAESGQEKPKLWSPGVTGAAVAWLIASVGFSLYVDNFGSYGKTYGALAGVVVLLLWLWAGFFALLIGASYEAVGEGERPRDAEADSLERELQRDAVADTPTRTDV
ncbi:YihY/virulence factor BrkB family protein [Aeromicrobium sp. Leaf350]|uniref:YihY/virulence factor BrkB family protein n=1 Tax=Aeromicrobium sp. Leaf350 TaxID=2876565 RepID=UPI001E65AFED|nr:YihY/virulence factor BrkB family protein [Aeromicrobium sp. Leaf350]